MIDFVQGDCIERLKELPDRSINCCVTSPPYFGLRDYGMEEQVGLEGTIEEYIHTLIIVFREVKRALRDDVTLWLNLGDSYAANRSYQVTDTKHCDVGNRKGSKIPTGLKPKDLIGIPWRVAFALQADGWYLRQDIIWAKPNLMPESVKDRCTKSHEYIFLFSKKPKYYFDYEAIQEPAAYPKGPNSPGSIKSPHGQGFSRKAKVSENRKELRSDVESRHRTLEKEPSGLRRKRSVWTVSTALLKEAHFATFPPKLITPCILAGCPEDGTVLDPFAGAGTVGVAAIENDRNAVLIELNPEYVEIAKRRVQTTCENVFM